MKNYVGLLSLRGLPRRKPANRLVRQGQFSLRVPLGTQTN